MNSLESRIENFKDGRDFSILILQLIAPAGSSDPFGSEAYA
jgi:hypothetical protein